ncbi:MAG: putative DNA binding domain-containing protein [Proteobacteria bacterium]|nr:putative DNA binding domain-containing protein [Pseudomonadota bacterium]MBU1714351.1 putative DNA binding domain-containing protein [Pseudomonadota bacterium]
MIDIKATLKRLLGHDYETEVLEFKEAKNDYSFQKIGQYFSALANEANLLGKKEAWLIFGVRDKDKAIVGSRYRTNPARLQSLKKEIADKTNNRISFKDIHEVETDRGRVVLFQIPAAPPGIPVSWEGVWYGRDGESLVKLNIEEIERIRKQGREEDWSKKICEGATISDLAPEAIQKARELFAEKNTKLAPEMQEWDDRTFLNKAKLCIRDKVTRTAILLLGKSESEHFLQPGLARISWILKDRDNIEKDYAHFSCPLLLSAEEVYGKIRNLTYRYLAQGTLFPQEVDSYDPYIIREALNNCIAHQDYSLGGKINVVEREDSQLIFTNMGSFIPQTIENVIEADAPEPLYRNPFLAEAMVNLKMIDTIGSGIKRMFNIQRRKFFPLPEYSFNDNQVKVVVTGKVLDMKYAVKLAQMPELSLHDIMLLDKVQKGKALSDVEVRRLKHQKLIEGRKPNFHISSQVAIKTGQKADYMKLKGINDEYCKKIIIDYLKKFGTGQRTDFENILLDKLPDVLDDSQKKNKVKNLLQAMKKEGVISILGKTWSMSKKMNG